MSPGPVSGRDRAWSRLRRRFKVTLNDQVAFTVDVCGGGFCAVLLRPISPGKLISGAIQAGERSVPYAGRVVWAKGGAVYHGIRSRVGVAFTTVDASLALSAFLEERGDFADGLPVEPGAGGRWTRPPPPVIARGRGTQLSPGPGLTSGGEDHAGGVFE